MKIFYQDGQEMRLGDIVNFAGAKASVVAIGPTNDYSIRFPRHGWEESIEDSFLIEFENGGLLRLDDPQNAEDLQLVARAPKE